MRADTIPIVAWLIAVACCWRGSQTGNRRLVAAALGLLVGGLVAAEAWPR